MTLFDSNLSVFEPMNRVIIWDAVAGLLSDQDGPSPGPSWPDLVRIRTRSGQASGRLGQS